MKLLVATPSHDAAPLAMDRESNDNSNQTDELRKGDDEDPNFEFRPSGLGIEQLRVGQGKAAAQDDRVTVHYVGKLPDDSVFDSSYQRKSPLRFKLGSGQLIKGFDEGVKGMKVGGKRRLIIPPALGYGKRGAPPKIPPDTLIIFEVELLELHSP